MIFGKMILAYFCWIYVPPLNSQFAMTFSNLQVRLNEAGFCEQNGVDKHRVLTELLHAFGIMAFKEFSATPISLMKCMFF